MSLRASASAALIRLLDVVFAAVGIILLSPVLALVAVILRVTNERCVIFKQERIGYGERPFLIYKFVTMMRDSPNIGSRFITSKNDPRIFAFGVFLRKSKLNELPQLFNVLKGDMSLIGPRPMIREGFDFYPPAARGLIGSVRPGLSGVGSIVLRNEESLLQQCEGDRLEFYKQNVSPRKAELEIWFVRKKSVLLYLILILITIVEVIFPGSNVIFRIYPELSTLSLR
jgi:lipopolysaccharide/colanic/teichoic acid biosynthesis glycosyltransferase